MIGKHLSTFAPVILFIAVVICTINEPIASNGSEIGMKDQIVIRQLHLSDFMYEPPASLDFVLESLGPKEGRLDKWLEAYVAHKPIGRHRFAKENSDTLVFILSGSIKMTDEIKVAKFDVIDRKAQIDLNIASQKSELDPGACIAFVFVPLQSFPKEVDSVLVKCNVMGSRSRLNGGLPVLVELKLR